MKKTIFRALAKLNKAILPSYSKRQLDLSKASKLQLAIIGWRIYITKNALEQEKTTQW
ncbi:SsrA-binding protein [uncultured Winogradskyella sp.]|uniref:SsrA-binding protein n=1 Tax=uncultured Winogradskyella sp. TaxID=395353 RepID=UPI0030DC6BED|tara:strand:+ start:377 stop:550 length:174 start_codon:yes stop_codon:yes gene_type:complete